ncbi:hypothetical protein MesoLj113b_72600 (plasmid) [Mesorhizobium sp. 113-3-3]|nr:hypothetical protein MesoLj113b_72600 [Mesorhizobium sp. 113-3-3]
MPSVSAILVLLDNNVAMTMMRSIHRAADYDRVGAMVPATVIEESDIAMTAVMEAMAFAIDDHTIIVPMMVSVMSMGLNYDRVSRGHGWYEQAQCQSTKNGGFHLRSSTI